MKKTLLFAALLGASGIALAETEASDTLKVSLSEVNVLATRAQSNTPIAYTNVTAAEIEQVNYGYDLPFLLSKTPGVLVTSDAGAGVGYTSLRVRGTDATRINITANDIPMNDAESHTIYWVNTPDLASSLADAQVQRGAGTSTNGSGAFGGSVNMMTQHFSVDPYAEFYGSYGSFNTQKETAKVGTGLILDHWMADVRLSRIASDGYRDRATSSLKGYFAQMGYFNDKTSVKFITFGGKEITYHAWDGISREQLKTDRTYNPNGEIKRDGKVVGFYDDQIDDYCQTHYQLLWNQILSPAVKFRLALHYTDGYGFYQEYKNNRTLKEYLLEPVVTPEGTLKKASLVRKKLVDSGFGGAVFSLNYNQGALDATFGGAANWYSNTHYGRVLWVENYTAQLSPDHEYYRNKGKKNDFNIYAKGNYAIADGLNVYADLQYRHVGYTINGNNDKWDWTAQPEHLQTLNIDEPFDFFNPKLGLNYNINKNHRVYASVAVAQKEPTRNNYTDGLFLQHPRAERLTDWELGYEFKSSSFTAGVNFYYMNYKDQLVLNGKLNEIGELMAENVPHSYRLGMELTASWRPVEWFTWSANATLSRNRIKDYVGYVSDYDATTWDDLYTQSAIECGNTTIAFSPSVIANNIFDFHVGGFEAQVTSQYVSRQYLDNFANREDSLDPFFVSNLNMAYTFKALGMKSITAGVAIYNLFDARYETNGYSQTCALIDSATGARQLYSDPRFYPMAGINLLAHIALKF